MILIFIRFSALERKISVRANREELVQKGILLPDSQISTIPENGKLEKFLLYRTTVDFLQPSFQLTFLPNFPLKVCDLLDNFFLFGISNHELRDIDQK